MLKASGRVGADIGEGVAVLVEEAEIARYLARIGDAHRLHRPVGVAEHQPTERAISIEIDLVDRPRALIVAIEMNLRTQGQPIVERGLAAKPDLHIVLEGAVLPIRARLAGPVGAADLDTRCGLEEAAERQPDRIGRVGPAAGQCRCDQRRRGQKDAPAHLSKAKMRFQSFFMLMIA